MEYVLEIRHEHGIFSRIESETAIPIPNVGDEILFTEGLGRNSEGMATVKVVNRRFTSIGQKDGSVATALVEVFCTGPDNR